MEIASAVPFLPEAPSDGSQYARISGTWGVVNWTSLAGKPATFPPTLPIAQSGVTNLTTDLAAKVDVAGDTMTGNLTINPPAGNAGLTLNPTAASSQATVQFSQAASLKWQLGKQTNDSFFLYDAVSTTTVWDTASNGATLNFTRAVALNGGGTAPTPTAGDNDTSIATTAFVTGALATGLATKVNDTGDTMTGDLTIAKASPAVIMNKAASGQNNAFYGRTAGVDRWIFLLGDGTAESAGNGSHLAVYRYNDAGTFLDSPFSINRLSGQTVISNLNAQAGTLASPSLTGNPTAPTPATADNDTSIATTAHVQANAALKLSLTGGTLAGVVTASGAGQIIAISPAGVTIAAVPGSSNIEARGAGAVGDAAYMTFHRPGSWAAAFGVDTDNVWKVGGWSMGAVSYRVVHEGLANPIVPANPTLALGIATKQYVDAADNLKVAKAGDTMTGPLTLTSMNLNAVAGSYRLIYGQTAGVSRWRLDFPDGTAESGGNAGSNFAINRFNDAGAFTGASLSISRATGLATVEANPTTALGIATKQYVDAAIAAMYPVGSLYFSTNATNPGTYLGFGTWAAFGAGKVPVGFLAADADFGTDEATGGEKTHTLLPGELANHTHNASYSLDTVITGASIRWRSSGISGTDTTGNITGGGGGAHNNLQPFIVVRMWKRTA